MKKLLNSNIFWEVMGYISLGFCIFGQITVGYIYLTAQVAFLVSNIIGLVRSCAIKLPTANIIRDVVFTAITAALIVIYIFK